MKSTSTKKQLRSVCQSRLKISTTIDAMLERSYGSRLDMELRNIELCLTLIRKLRRRGLLSMYQKKRLVYTLKDCMRHIQEFRACITPKLWQSVCVTEERSLRHSDVKGHSSET